MRNAILILCLILMCILGWFYCQTANECCDVGDAATGAATTENTADAPPTAAEVGMEDYLMFNWSDGEPVLRDDWDKYKADLIANLPAGQNMEITGLYRSDETNNTSFDNLGLARANKVKSLLSPPIASDRITLQSKLVNDGADKNKLFTSVDFRNFRKTASIDQSIPDKTVIRFPFNSTNKLSDAEVETYLKQVAVRVNQSGEQIRLTGHTDDIGSASSNVTLGQRRADIIKNYLVNQGVAASKIITNSRGETAPVATNDTEAGRAQNRRTELEIIK